MKIQIVENSGCVKKRLNVKKDNLYIFFSISASKWKSLFWTAIYNMEKGRSNSPLVLQSFVVETDFYFLFRKKLFLILFSAQVT